MTYITIDNKFPKRVGLHQHSMIELDTVQMNKFKRFVDHLKEKWYSMFMEQEKGKNVMVIQSKKRLENMTKDVYTNTEYKMIKRNNTNSKKMDRHQNNKENQEENIRYKDSRGSNVVEMKINDGVGRVVYTECQHHKYLVKLEESYRNDLKEQFDYKEVLEEHYKNKLMIQSIMDEGIIKKIKENGYQMTFLEVVKTSILKDKIIARLKQARSSYEVERQIYKDELAKLQMENSNLYNIIMKLNPEKNPKPNIEEKKISNNINQMPLTPLNIKIIDPDTFDSHFIDNDKEESDYHEYYDDVDDDDDYDDV
jgi:hypothetical protein